MYTYDADGRRSSKQTADGLRYYVWDGDQLAVTIAPGSDPFFALTLSASGKEEDVALTLSVGTTYYAKVNGTVYSAVATHNSGQADLSRGRWDDTEIPEVPPDPKPETFTELEIGGFWFSISDKTGRGTVYGPAGKTIELYTNDPSTALPTVSYVRGLSLVAAVRDGVRTYYHYNAHGDVVQLTNSSGTVAKNYTYDAFGVEKNAAASDANPFRYCGEQFDSETGNYYLRARYYSPGVGRFTQEDPVMDGLNWYTYCAGNPVVFVDPSGCVLVGLREYASTYKGATVNWNNDTRTATVTYGNKTLSVVADSNNLIDNHIYIDDSRFVRAFGVGGKIVVYQDSVTHNISIRASFNYRGEDAYARMPGSESEQAPWGQSYSTIFLNGIEEYWSGTFDNYNVSTYARYHGDGITARFKNKQGVSKVWWPLFVGWSPKNPGSVTMYSGDSRANRSETFEEYKWAAAHEFGHLLGVGDAYTSKQSKDVTSVYNVYGTPVQPGDIEKVIKAWQTGKPQQWP